MQYSPSGTVQYSPAGTVECLQVEVREDLEGSHFPPVVYTLTGGGVGEDAVSGIARVGAGVGAGDGAGGGAGDGAGAPRWAVLTAVLECKGEVGNILKGDFPHVVLQVGVGGLTEPCRSSR